MIELEIILKEHVNKYPIMMPCDAVKLVYQNEFGGGHLIADPYKSFEFLKNEYKNVVQLKELPLFEHIGNRIVRLNLAALEANDFSIDKLNELFIKSSALIKGSKNTFMSKLNILSEQAKTGMFSFNNQSLESYLKEYVNKGYPPVSHSKEYKHAYNPAYRIVLSDLL